MHARQYVLAAVVAVAAAGAVAAAHAVDGGIQFAGTDYRIFEDYAPGHYDQQGGYMWLWNPDNSTAVTYGKNFTGTVNPIHVGHWDIVPIHYADPNAGRDVHINLDGIWADLDVSDMYMFVHLLNVTDAQAAHIDALEQEVEALEADIEELQEKAGKQSQRLKTLERQVAALAGQQGNLPPATNLPP